MWFNILKNLQATTQTSGSFDFEEEEIPEQDEDDECKKWLQEYHNIIVKYKGLVLKQACPYNQTAIIKY